MFYITLLRSGSENEVETGGVKNNEAVNIVYNHREHSRRQVHNAIIEGDSLHSIHWYIGVYSFPGT